MKRILRRLFFAFFFALCEEAWGLGKVRVRSIVLLVLVAYIAPATCMPPFEDYGAVAGSRGWQKRRGHRKQLSSSSTFGSVSSLPEYRRSGRHTPSTSLSAIWDTEGDPTPPPDYSDPVTLVVEAPSSADEADEESEEISPSPRHQLVRHRRSYSLRSPSHKEIDIDAILERSVNALEMSNALLQSSMSTRDILSNVLADDPNLDRSLENHTQYLSRRMAITQEQEAGMADIMKSVDSLLDEGGGISRSAPPTTHLHRQMDHAGFSANAPHSPSNLHLDTEPSHSFSPESPDPIPVYPYPLSSDTLIQSEYSEYRSPPSTNSAPPTVTQHPFSPSTPAYHLLSSIVARSPPSPSKYGRRSNRISPLPSSSVQGVQGRDRGLSSASTSDLRSHAGFQQPGYSSRVIRRVRSSDDTSALDGTSPNTVAPFPKSSLVPIMTPRFFTRLEKRGEAGRTVVAAETVKILRQILADDAGTSEIARGKRPAKDERACDRPVAGKGGGFLPMTAPVATLALAGPSGSTAKVVPLDGSSRPPVTPSPPRSAMRGRFPSPRSSGRNSPRNVSFLALPPKGTRTASALRAVAPSGGKKHGKKKEDTKRKGWLSDWFLPSSSRGARVGFARDQLETWMV